jgi:hypothetical protein
MAAARLCTGGNTELLIPTIRPGPKKKYQTAAAMISSTRKTMRTGIAGELRGLRAT